MLLADKHDLQQRLKLQILQIEEKELNHYTTNANTLGTQAALLAGFAFTSLIEAPWYEMLESNEKWRVAVCVCTALMGLLFEVMAVLRSVQLAILAPKLALRGPDGSMTRAVLVMRREERRMHWYFYAGLFFFWIAITFILWTMFPWEIALPATFLLLAVLLWLCYEANVLDQELRLPPRAAGVANLWDSSEQPSPSLRRATTAAPLSRAAPPGYADGLGLQLEGIRPSPRLGDELSARRLIAESARPTAGAATPRGAASFPATHQRRGSWPFVHGRAPAARGTTSATTATG